ncbi:MBL fold metallo-hydrolase [Rhizosphaericola mali]|uniref:MBL fold metallo-hydrolase n=1 Tax=Rhizosphaericola mali TaxID=2545455 RepID=A0A5P2FY85_9BACT|nr:MBL fold metallo-hydrolase [Rhizosphaericola mali]QES88504.1 MBL fold metallo-hydrolase [Rhizosphaericola mali]
MKYKLNCVITVITILFLLSFKVFTVNAQSEKNALISQPGYYKIEIGDYEVTALSDGTCMLDMSKLLLNAQPGEVQKILEQNVLNTTVETSINAYLIRHGEKLILVDAGCGTTMGNTLGLVTKSIRRAGYKPEQINAVLITHLHIDHIGGLTQNGKMVFPNAILYINKHEASFWLDSANLKKAPENAKQFFEPAVTAIAPYLKAGRVHLFENGSQLFSGISAQDAVGHTPGHTFYSLESKGDKMVFWGDLVHCGVVQFEDPAVSVGFDVDTAGAAMSRIKEFDKAAQAHYWIAAPHLSFPGIGHLRHAEKSYIWIPANYSIIRPK